MQVSGQNMGHLKTIIALLTIEKMAQHFLTSVFFIFDVPGIGKPDIGPVFRLGNDTMAILNLVLLTFFALGLFGEIRHYGWALNLVGFLAVLDILLEVSFHGPFYLTVSVLVSAALIVAIILYGRRDRSQHVQSA